MERIPCVAYTVLYMYMFDTWPASDEAPTRGRGLSARPMRGWSFAEAHGVLWGCLTWLNG